MDSISIAFTFQTKGNKKKHKAIEMLHTRSLKSAIYIYIPATEM